MAEPDHIMIGRDEAVKLMAISVMLKDGELCLRGDEQETEALATDAITDLGEEIALQLVGY